MVGVFGLTRTTAHKEALVGAIVPNTPPAPDFVLTDHNGKRIAMHDLLGKPVALTFLYTHCPDVCPLIANTMGAADRQLGSETGKLEMLAVSVDPAGDTPSSIHKFNEDRGLEILPNWHYLTGSPSQLARVWQAYGGVANPASIGQALTPTELEHLALVYLIDPQGRMRAALPANFSVSDLLQDVRSIS